VVRRARRVSQRAQPRWDRDCDRAANQACRERRGAAGRPAYPRWPTRRLVHPVARPFPLRALEDPPTNALLERGRVTQPYQQPGAEGRLLDGPWSLRPRRERDALSHASQPGRETSRALEPRGRRRVRRGRRGRRDPAGELERRLRRGRRLAAVHRRPRVDGSGPHDQAVGDPDARAVLHRRCPNPPEPDSRRRGPYRWVRHPSYSGLVLFFVLLGLALSNSASLGVLAAVPVAGLLVRIRSEERALLTSLGDDYRRYAARRRRLFPGIW